MNDPSIDFKAASRYRKSGPSEIRALIISPTRELAEQIAVEARKVAFGTGVLVQTAVGGTQKRAGLMKIQKEGCHLLIGTPGRLKDILSDPYTGVSAPKLNTLILDEADRLLDQGFSQEIEEIQQLLPNPTEVDRQTLMFSATVPREVMQMVRKTMKPTFKHVNTVREDEVPTHTRVPQKLVYMRGLENALPSLLELAKRWQTRRESGEDLRPFKAIAYFNSTAETKISADVFNEIRRTSEFRRSSLSRLQFLEINSRLSQAARTRSADTFRRTTEGILLSSDVTARGMDFPDVTHVIQLGIPRDRETYIHRIGRTARAGKEGEGWLFAHQGEQDVLRQRLAKLPLAIDTTSLPVAAADLSQEIPADAPYASTLEQFKQGFSDIPRLVKVQSYMGQLGTATGNFTSKRLAIHALNQMAINGYGMETPPPISSKIAQLMGLNRIEGVRISSGRDYSDSNDASPRAFDRPIDRGFARFGERGAERSYAREFGRGGVSRGKVVRDDAPWQGRGRRSHDRSDRGDRGDRFSRRRGDESPF